MTRHFRKVVFLLLASMLGGVASAIPEENATGIDHIYQNETATGVVKDASGEEVIGASVIVKGTTNGTVSDFNGYFSLQNVRRGDIIQISFVGYVAQEVRWNGQPLNIILKEDSRALDEVVVVGFGTQKKLNLTGAVSTVDARQSPPVLSTPLRMRCKEQWPA